MSNLDLSSFPLLRIDQINEHSTETLKESEKQLLELQRGKGIHPILPFVSKLLVHIRGELSNRVRHNVSNQKRQFTLQRNNASRRDENKRTNASPARNYGKQKPAPTFFVPSSPESSASSFRSRSKQVKASLQARSQEAINLKHETLRYEYTRKALLTMQEWRAEREQSKQRREQLLHEERMKARIHRRDRRQYEKQVRCSMQTAAEEAKSLALQSGSSPDEAILQAASAAAKVVDDQSTVFDKLDAGDSDIDSFFDASSCDERNDLSLLEGNSQKVEVPLDVENAENELDAAPDAFVELDLKLQKEEHATQENTVSDAKFDLSNSVLQCNSVLPCNSVDRNDESLDADLDSHRVVGTDQGEITDLVDTLCNDDQAEDKKDESSVSLSANTSPKTCEEIQYDEIDSHGADREVHVVKTTSPIHPEEQNVLASDLSESTDKPCNDVDSKAYTPSRPQSKFTAAFPSIFHIFSQFMAGSRSKTAEKDLIKCLRSQVERCSRIDVVVDSDIFNDEPDLFYHIKSNRPEIKDIISRCFSDRRMSRWEEATDDGLWNLMWTWGMPKASDFEHLLVFQKISRFRHTRGLTRKDLLKKNIINDGFSIMPLTYALPHEFNSFVKGFASVENASGTKRPNFWIIKPIGLSRGRGISLVDSVSDVSYSQPIVIQKYIADPLCFMGYKFDLRVYVLSTSFNPLEAFIYKEGLARFGSRKYSASPQLLNDLRVHLTNSSIQKEFGCELDRDHPAYLAGSNGAESKVAMTWLFDRLGELGIDSKLLWKRITDVCLKALIAGGSDIPFQPNSFELFGFDLMFDESLKCWLIEVNSSPSMSCDTALDMRIKGSLIRDTVLLVDPPPINQGALVDVSRRRLSHRKEASDKSSGDILEQDLRKILNDTLPRAYGTLPKRLGAYERIAPCTGLHDQSDLT